MKAQVLEGFGPAESGPLRLKDVPVPAPGPHDVLLRVLCCGVCHTDLHTVEGELPDVRLPRVPGHEVVGMVEKTGEKAGRFKPGDRVGAAWLHSACGECSFCGTGRENLCREARFTGLHFDGGYAEFAVVPEAFAYRLPEGPPTENIAPLLCGGIIGYRSLRKSGIRPGGRLGLYGFGASAHIALQIAVHEGCRVYAFSRSEEHRALALELGAGWAGGPEDVPDARLDAAVIFAPVGRLYVNALKNLERGGTVVSAGIHMSPIPEFDYSLLYHERKMSSVANATRNDGEELLRLAAEIPIRTTVEVFPLEQAGEALKAMKAGRINGAAVLRVG